MSPPPAREWLFEQTFAVAKGKKKINNCIANRKVYYGNIIDEYERQREIFILVKKS